VVTVELNINLRFLMEMRGYFVDKVSCLAYLLYQSSKNQNIKERAIQLLNGDVTLLELKRNPATRELLTFAEAMLRRNKVDKLKVQLFVQEFLLIEI
jgi:hypothetical protein